MEKYFNPFPGLRPFTAEDSNLFFGRETECDEIILKLLQNRYITVIGPSGSGKSSLVNSGIVSKLVKLKAGESSGWEIISVKPGNDALGNLADALSNTVKNSGQRTAAREIILSELLNNDSSFSEVAEKHLKSNNDNILLIIDQFEELFRYASSAVPGTSQTASVKFVDFVLKSFIEPAHNVFAIIVMKTEYLGECSQYKGLTGLLNNSNYLVPSMGQENLREAIVKPVTFAGAKIDKELVDTIINNLTDRTDQLALLQHAMMRTWARWQEFNEPGRPINKADYESAGTIRNAVSQHADEIYEELNTRGKEICEKVFKAITRKGPNNKGVSIPSDITKLKSVSGCSDKELFEVIERFRSPSVSFIKSQVNASQGDSSVIDIQSECILQNWNRLKDWIDEEDSSMQMYLRLSEASALYQQGKTGLYRPPELLSAIKWRERQNPDLAWAVQYNTAFERTMVYLRTSEKAYLEEEQNSLRLQKNRNKRTRLITRLLSGFVLLSLGFIFIELLQKSAAERQSALAEKLRNQAVNEKAIADSFAAIVFKHNIVSDSTAAAAVKDAEEAKELKIKSDIQKSLAERKAREANQLRTQAEEQKAGIQRMRMLSVSKSMSLKSLQLTGQKDLQTLLAYQAYLFNKRYNGHDNDADIYAGLYNAALQYGSINFRSFKGHAGDIKSIAFIPGENEFFTSGNDGKILKWSLGKKDQTLQVIYSGSDIIDVLAVSPDASWLACGSSNSSIRMIPLQGNIPGYEMTGHKGGITSLVFSYDGKYLYSAALDGKVLKWDIAARTSVNVSTGLPEITSVDISSKGNYLAGISADGNVIVWNPGQNADNFRIETAGKHVKVVKFNPGNNLLALGDDEGTVELWDINLHKKLSEVKAHDGQINDIQFNASLKQMATAGNDKKLKIFDVKDPADLTEPPVILSDNDGFVLVLKFSPDGQMIVSGESEGPDNILGRPSHADYLVNDICTMIRRNMTREEWNVYVGKDIPPEKTCPDKSYNIKVEPITSLRK
jgi:WD40 repeat protein/energy-coupling factor transporter ATP-binding protein EcfA2